jgi:hypothetical protein
MSSYTPGPWKWFNYPNETKLLAAPSAAVIHCPDGPMGITPEDQALIAVAPELLSSLKRAQPEYCSMRCPSVFRGPDSARHIPECLEMQEAIAKAEGLAGQP